ncbi:MAG: hypothetical protein ACYTHN_08410 [Planctomycetota bacterium]
MDEEDEPPAKPLTDKERVEAQSLIRKARDAFTTIKAQADKSEIEGQPFAKGEIPEEMGDAIALHEEILDRFPGARGLDGVLYQLGMLRKYVKDFSDAHEAFFKILKHYPGSKRFTKVLDVEMVIACRLLEGERVSFLGMKILSGRSLGAEILEKLLEVAPFAKFAPEALYLLGNYKLEKREFDDAVVLYETLVRRFHYDPMRKKAEFQAARAYFLKFRGLSYDLIPLEESLRRFEAFIEVHADDPDEETKILVGIDRGEKAGKDVPRFTGARAWVEQITNLLAEKNFEIGSWYRRRGYTKAARVYYQVVQQKYPYTPWAEKAGERLKSMGEPEEEEEKKEGEKGPKGKGEGKGKGKP